MPMRILMSGVNGLLGATVASYLTGQGDTIVPLVRHTPNQGEIFWEPDGGHIDAPGLEGFDAVVHLASRPWSGSWTAEFQRQMRENRLRTNSLLAASLTTCTRKPKVLICASGQGAYPSSGDQILAEDGPIGTDFLAQLQRDGEAVTAAASVAGIRVVHLRIANVLSGPTIMQTAGNLRPLGSGEQWWSWVARDEMGSIVRHILVSEAVEGPVNVASPHPIRNAEYTALLASMLGREMAAPVPAAPLRQMLGEMADALLLASRRLEPRKLLATRYVFRFPTLGEALRHELALHLPQPA